MDLIISNRVISASAYDILLKLRASSDGLLSSIIDRGDNVLCTCPFHKMGKESHPSCGVYARRDGEKQFGLVHCFTCGYSASLPKFVGDVLNKEESYGEQWLLTHFGDVFLETDVVLNPIKITQESPKKPQLDESILAKYDYYHPYMWKRGLSKEVVDKFRVGYDRDTKSITFPIWDEFGCLVGISKRNVETKRFDIQHGIKKPVYLLNYIKQCGISNIYVAESQINALTLWTWGYPAVAMLGTGCKEQYDALNHAGIRVFNLCFDGDTAGQKAIDRFKKNIKSDCFIRVIKMPNGKDVNDLTKEEFDKLKDTPIFG